MDCFLAYYFIYFIFSIVYLLVYVKVFDFCKVCDIIFVYIVYIFIFFFMVFNKNFKQYNKMFSCLPFVINSDCLFILFYFSLGRWLSLFFPPNKRLMLFSFFFLFYYSSDLFLFPIYILEHIVLFAYLLSVKNVFWALFTYSYICFVRYT